jgi:tetrahydromethanopterin S-methyltransferase subunit G
MERCPMTEPIAYDSNYTDSGPVVLPSPVRRLITDIQARTELKAARVAAGQAPADEFERQFKVILDGLRALPADRVAAVTATLTRPLQLQRTSRRYQTFAQVDPMRPGALGAVDLAAVHRPRLAGLAETWVHIPSRVDGLADLADEAVTPQATYSGLNFYLRKVKCLKETPWDWGSDSDEIYLGASFIDETGDVSSAAPFEVSDDFDTGEVVDYGYPGKHLQFFNITEAGNKFPKYYTAMINMMEEDFGNVSGWFNSIYSKIQAEVSQELQKLGYQVGQLIGLGQLGSLIGQLFAEVFKALLSWLASLFDNNNLGTIKTIAAVNNYSGNWSGAGSPVWSGWQDFTGDGAHYRLWYMWELVK